MAEPRPEGNRDEILHENRHSIPRAEIKYIGWLTRSGAKKSTTSIIIEFARPEDANKIIGEGLCKTTMKCGYCAQEHQSRDCPSKRERDGPRKPQAEAGSKGSGQKRASTGSGPGPLDKENEAPSRSSSQRPQRTYYPTRKALESLDVNGIGRNSSQQMDIDEESDL
ncbi:hypothetical protein CERZMDRAFT_113576 [Cercospora zeae-maydis SCOH1-5]|uniref:CCHC-type domain-containing protein n=1 Tax=Cercospora zeae-maydis SCOH1-5 TaxID=717836 RepID=A0A6A6F9U8_9PEZI|nr:hypothetical protein CERZMDRAFT_113576 [Cercospora zeae-maydis SCOH1-5]